MQLQRKGGPAEAGIFLNMAVEKTSIPLVEFAISHERIANLAENYKYRDNQKNRNGQTTPPTSFMRRFPDTPRVKLLLK
ncbi:8222_t:CDS:2 [Funneliformis geosporum]|uniref:8222_t:CDS:1 n=1 Tax=Funneliformis geosporum TaxID=1117311 RepID=A0A9W4X3T3_9GLOM|nr:8222_t:CDS:2 [Funneliformis geosporum]